MQLHRPHNVICFILVHSEAEECPNAFSHCCYGIVKKFRNNSTTYLVFFLWSAGMMRQGENERLTLELWIR